MAVLITLFSLKTFSLLVYIYIVVPILFTLKLDTLEYSFAVLCICAMLKKQPVFYKVCDLLHFWLNGSDSLRKYVVATNSHAIDLPTVYSE